MITIGRSSVDLYGAQVEGPLDRHEVVPKIHRRGSPTNIARGAARGLGPKSAVRLPASGTNTWGGFDPLSELAREGADTRGVATDPERLTAPCASRHQRRKSQLPLICPGTRELPMAGRRGPSVDVRYRIERLHR